MAKGRVRRHTNEFKLMCVERMKECDNIGVLARELNIHRRMLYRWRDQLAPVEKGERRHRTRVKPGCAKRSVD